MRTLTPEPYSEALGVAGGCAETAIEEFIAAISGKGFQVRVAPYSPYNPRATVLLVNLRSSGAGAVVPGGGSVMIRRQEKTCHSGS